MRVVDLGCGDGIELEFFHLDEGTIFGIDRNSAAIFKARRKFPERIFLSGLGERLPFADGSIDTVVSNVALPYMNISKALKEIHRVLSPGGIFQASLHYLRYTLSEFQGQGGWIFKLFRLLVILNGFVFYLTGWAPGESFQTERGMRIALKHAGFSKARFRRHGRGWFVEAVKP